MRGWRLLLASVLAASAAAAIVLACGSFGSTSPSADLAEADVEADTDTAVDAGSDTAVAPACPNSIVDNFERDAALAEPWTELDVSAGATVDIPESTWVNGKYLTTTTPSVGTFPDAERPAALVRREATPKVLRCTFWMRLNATVPVNGTAIDVFRVAVESVDGVRSVVRVGANGGFLSIRDDYVDTQGCCSGCCPKKYADAGAPLATMQWYKLTFETDFQNARMTENGSTLVEGTFQPLKAGTLRISIGLGNFGTAAASVSYDNLRCDFEC